MRRLLVPAALIGGVAVAYWLVAAQDSGAAGTGTPSARPDYGRPRQPPDPSQPQRHVPVPMPEKPELTDEDRVALRGVYDEAAARGDRPGEAAFRAGVDRFVEYNMEFAREKMREEGLTLGEVTELTYLGYLVLQTQNVAEIEGMVGRTFSDAEKEKLGALMTESNAEFTRTMREAVARGATEDERMAMILATEESYKERYFALTGMNAVLLDDLLAGDIAREGAPIATPPPDEVEPQPYVAPEPRPGAPR